MRKNKIILIFFVALICGLVLFLIYRYASQSSVNSGDTTDETDAEEVTISFQNEETSNESLTSVIVIPAETSSVAHENTNKTNAKYIKPTQEATYSIQEIETSKWKSFSFSINGKSLSFPISLSALSDLEYELSEQNHNQSLDFGAIDNPNVYKNGDEKEPFFNVYITNNTELSLPLSECKVIGLSLIFANCEKNLDVKIDNLSIHEGMSQEELISLLGNPTQKQATNSIVTLTYSNEDGNKYWNFGFDNEKLVGFDIYVN